MSLNFKVFASKSRLCMLNLLLKKFRSCKAKYNNFY